MEDRYISNVAEFLQIVDELAKEYPSNPLVSNPSLPHFIYRGISDKDYDILPGIFRTEPDKKDDKKDKENKENGRRIKNKKYLTYASEEEILHDFVGEAAAYKPDIVTSDWLVRAELAQHYGVPTRLLDWTSNPLVSLYFACASTSNDDGAIWICHAPNFNRFSRKSISEKSKKIPIKEQADALITKGKVDFDLMPYPLIYIPYYSDHRMSAQSSYFMLWGTKLEPLAKMVDESCYMVLSPPEDIWRVYGEKQEKQFLFKICIHASEKQKIFRALSRMGINAKTLFPGLDGIGMHIEKKYRFDYSEVLPPV